MRKLTYTGHSKKKYKYSGKNGGKVRGKERRGKFENIVFFSSFLCVFLSVAQPKIQIYLCRMRSTLT